MGTTSDKLTYLNTTKGKIKDVINMTGANITSDTTFRNYATKLYDGYISVLKDKNTLLDNMPKGTSTGAITDAADLPLYEYKMSKESTQDGTPTPENPVEVKTVKGYRNLFDGQYYQRYTGGSAPYPYASAAAVRSGVVKVQPNTTYTISKEISNRFRISQFTEYPVVNVSNAILYTYLQNEGTLTKYTITTESTTEYLVIQVTNESQENVRMQVVEGTEELPYVPYGNNYVYTAVSNGTDTNYYTLPLNGNEIAGTINYKDEYIIDKNGHCWLNKKFPKKIFTENDNWVRQSVYTNNTRYVLNDTNVVAQIGTQILSNYFLKGKGGTDTVNIDMNGGNGWLMITIPNTIAPTLADFKNWLQTKYNEDNPVYALYVTTIPQLIDLNYTVDIELFKGINNISNSDDMDMEIKYIKDTYE